MFCWEFVLYKIKKKEKAKIQTVPQHKVQDGAGFGFFLFFFKKICLVSDYQRSRTRLHSCPRGSRDSTHPSLSGSHGRFGELLALLIFYMREMEIRETNN